MPICSTVCLQLKPIAFILFVTYSLSWCISNPATRCLHIVQPVLFAALFYKSTVSRFQNPSEIYKTAYVCKWTRHCDEFIIWQKSSESELCENFMTSDLRVLQYTRTEFIVVNSCTPVDTNTSMQTDINNSVFFFFFLFFQGKKDIW